MTLALAPLRTLVGVPLLSEKREALHRKADLFVRKIKADNGDDAAVLLYDILDTLLEQEAALREEKSDRSEIRELIQEMRSGFAMMDKRFEDMQKSMDKRFEDMQKYMDKRFEDVNRRFEDVNRRFEDVNKRFDDVNKRFEDFNQRFSQLQWLMGLGMTLLTTLIVTLKLFAK